MVVPVSRHLGRCRRRDRDRDRSWDGHCSSGIGSSSSSSIGSGDAGRSNDAGSHATSSRTLSATAITPVPIATVAQNTTAITSSITCDSDGPQDMDVDVVEEGQGIVPGDKKRNFGWKDVQHVADVANVSYATAMGGAASARAVLQATDQLVDNSLVGNLVQLARDLMEKITTLGRGIAEGRARKAAAAAAAAPPPAPAAPAPSPFGAFGAAPQPAPAPAAAPAGPTVRDMDHALLAFAYQSRQTVTECLFYLAYHTQLTCKEVCSIIDLVQDLTNGACWERN
mmetsp:Transcript_19873/g.57098  ORF Transcript_19873/g.57098 Transcript_19873/m.57098 type:complete len:283 (-) Transcript_19873:538-1386(-)